MNETRSSKKNYLNNKDLLIQVQKSKKQGTMTNELALMLQTLTRKYAKKGNFANYSYNEDMQAYALLMLCKTWNSFDETKSNNPFAFFTQCIKNSFIQYLNQERRVRDIKNKSLIENGLNPSFSYILDYEEDFHEKREAIINGTYDEYIKAYSYFEEEETISLEIESNDPIIEETIDDKIEENESLNI